MNHVHCSSDISCPQDLGFLYSKDYIRRAGVIPFMIYNNTTYILLGYSKENNPVWADLGGRVEKGETTLDTALREFGEESRYVLPINLNNISKVLITSKGDTYYPDQVLLVVQVDSSLYNININQAFQNTLPRTQYEDEMSFLQWIPYDTFLVMGGLSKSMQQIQKLLRHI
jgi:ADP-ribose pyrophosphatase YjhB (NUDIX family)